MTFRHRHASLSLLLASTAALAAPAAAELHGRDLDGTPETFEVYYDDRLDVTWLADADLSATETFGVAGIDAQGGMSWATAQAWVAAMNGARFLGFDDWRLPRALPIDGSVHVYQNRADGSTDIGYSLGAPGTPHAGSTANEMSHLYYDTLGNPPAYDFSYHPTGCLVPPLFCVANPGPFAFGPFDVPGGGTYWSETAVTTDPAYAGYFHFFDFPVGFQGIADSSLGGAHAWPVRDGDVPPDTDGDGVRDPLDNCTLDANGPLASVGGPSQRDVDGDGYGSVCDADFDGDGFVNLADLAAFRSLFLTADPEADFDGNGLVNLRDFARFRMLFLAPPGPSGRVP
jgi:hypothetical protein